MCMVSNVRILIPEFEIRRRVHELADAIVGDYRSHGVDEIEVVQLLEGAAIFASDLMRAIYRASDRLRMQIQSMKASSYNGIESSGEVRVSLDIQKPIEGKHVLVVEDIVDTGLTLDRILASLKGHRPASLQVCTLLNKPERRRAEVPVDYIGFSIPDEFAIGYGLDCAGKFRELPYIGVFQQQPEMGK